MIYSLKRIIIAILFLLTVRTSVFALSENSTLSSTAPVNWTVVWDATWAWYWWLLVTDWNIKVNASALVSNPSADLPVSWSFWLQNASDSSDPTYWWATFDFDDSILSSYKAKLVNQNNWTFKLQWCAWSVASGWICFWDTWVLGWEVIYNRTNWTFNWCGWSVNLWWICLWDWTVANSLKLDTTAPTFSSTLFNANKDKSMIVSDNSFNTTYKVRLDDWWASNASVNLKTWTFTHDFRASSTSRLGNYLYSIEDVSWNKTAWEIRVVASYAEPLVTDINDAISASAKWLTYSISPWTKIANWTDKYIVSLILHDKYWNPIVNEWWKNVTVSLDMSNWLKTNMLESTSPIYDSVSTSQVGLVGIKFNSNDINTNLSNITASKYSSNWNYDIEVLSLAPSIWNDYKLKFIWSWLNYNVTWIAGCTASPYTTNEFVFTPAFWVSNINPSWWWNNISVNNKKDFTVTSSTNGGSVSWGKISSRFDITSPEFLTNYPVSFQDTNFSPNQTYSDNYMKECTWNLKNVSYLSFWYSDNCIRNELSSSNILWPNSWSFFWIPKLNSWLPVPASMIVNYYSDVAYKNGWILIGHPSISYVWWALVNNQIKIVWSTRNSSNSMNIQNWSSMNIVWTISKTDIATQIHKNAEILTRWWVSTSSKVLYSNWDYELSSWPSWKDTVIVKWNLKITWNLAKESWKMHWIIVLRKHNWEWWNVFIDDNVDFVAATIFTDWWLISWDWTTYYADNENLATNQLFIKWSIIVNNTIWWSYKQKPECPYIVTSCDFDTAKRYDLNLFRHYIKDVSWTGFTNNVLYWYEVDLSRDWYSTSPLIIEYDPDMQSNPPSGFKTYN